MKKNGQKEEDKRWSKNNRTKEGKQEANKQRRFHTKKRSRSHKTKTT